MATNLEIAGALKRTQKGTADWYYGGDNEAWPDIATAKASVPAAVRPGKTIGVYQAGIIVEYWWPTTAVADTDLILKTPDLSGKVDKSTTVNGKALTGNIALTADDVPEKTVGATNLYFTAARVLVTILTGLGVGSVSAVLASDSIISAIAKLQAQITNIYNTMVSTTADNNFTGTQTYNKVTTYGGTITGTGGVTRTVNFTPTLRANQDGAKLIGLDLTNVTYDPATGGNCMQAANRTANGSGYTNGSYQGILVTALTGVGIATGGGGAGINVVVAGGVPTISIINASLGYGQNWAIGDTFTIPAAQIGGTGAGAVFTVTATTFKGVTQIGLLVNDIQPSAYGMGNIGYGWTMYYAGMSH